MDPLYLRFLILKRQNGMCYVCGRQDNLELHHLLPERINHQYACIIVCGPVWDANSCHYKITNSGEKKYKKYRKYICNGWFKKLKFSLMVREIKRREKQFLTWENME